MALKSVGSLTKGVFGKVPTVSVSFVWNSNRFPMRSNISCVQLAVTSANVQQKRTNYKYIGMVEETDGSFAGDLNYGLNTLFFSELFRGILIIHFVQYSPFASVFFLDICHRVV